MDKHIRLSVVVSVLPHLLTEHAPPVASWAIRHAVERAYEVAAYIGEVEDLLALKKELAGLDKLLAVVQAVREKREFRNLMSVLPMSATIGTLSGQPSLIIASQRLEQMMHGKGAVDMNEEICVAVISIYEYARADVGNAIEVIEAKHEVFGA